MENPNFANDLQLRWKLLPRKRGDPKKIIREVINSLNPEKVILHRLKPRTQREARPNTLSSRHGLGAFPAHTDFVVSEVPPRYLVLAAGRPRAAETLIFDTRQLVNKFGVEYLQRCLFLLHGQTKRYCRLLTYKGAKSLFRYNKAVMIAQNREARIVSEFVENEMQVQCRINWLEHQIAIIDNWNVFHGRDACPDPDEVSLFRLAIWGDYELDN